MTAVSMRVFQRYIVLMRHIQRTYGLEPAGSHGVWGLDDYQFLVFLYGSAQLVDQEMLKPDAITNEKAVDEYADDYMYLAAVQFINHVCHRHHHHHAQVKTGPFGEHSPLLFDISGVKTWSKVCDDVMCRHHQVNTGMIKMYKAEVLGKFPVMQHFLFGSLLPFDEYTQSN